LLAPSRVAVSPGDRKQPPFELGVVDLPDTGQAMPIITAHVLAADGHARTP